MFEHMIDEYPVEVTVWVREAVAIQVAPVVNQPIGTGFLEMARRILTRSAV